VDSIDGRNREREGHRLVRNGGSAGSRPAEASESLLSLQLRVPDVLYAPDPGSNDASSGLIVHVEIRNRSSLVWEAVSPTGPLLEVVVLEPDGTERPLVLRQLPMLAHPARLDPGRGFLLPVRIILTDIPEGGATYQLRIRVEPGTEETTGTLRFDPRPSRG
jgi:hypothetical protein